MLRLQMLKEHVISRRFFSLSRDNAPHFLDCLLNLGRSSIQTRISRMLAWWWGVEIGQRCIFYGLPLFRRLPGSRIRIGDNCQFRSSQWSNLAGVNRVCTVSTSRSAAVIEIGRNCLFSGTIIGCASRISIGDRVMCGANVTITDTDWHATDWRDRLAGRPGEASPVVIGDDVWIGMNAIVLKGVEVGSQTVVAAGSVVTRSLPAGVIAAGQPAVVVRKLVGNENLGTIPYSAVPGGKFTQ
jgi:acetyltransferase-like isoleucine patch superfamily enzyme